MAIQKVLPVFWVTSQATFWTTFCPIELGMELNTVVKTAQKMARSVQNTMTHDYFWAILRPLWTGGSIRDPLQWF